MYFLARRLYLPYLVVFGTEVFVYQMAQIMLSCAIAAILPYVIYSLAEARERRTNAMSELLTLFTCYAFTTVNIISVDDNFQVGYLVVGVLSAYMLVVILVVLWGTLKSIYVSIRNYRLRRSYFKNRAKRREELKLNHWKRKKWLEKLYGQKQKSYKNDDDPLRQNY